MPHDAEFVVVVCENGNYRLTSEQELLVRDQIFGGAWEIQPREGLYQRSMTAIWTHLRHLEFQSVPVQDEHGRTRPLTDILLDLRMIVLNSSARDAIKMLDLVFGDDAQEMLRRFSDAAIVTSNHTQSQKHVNRSNAVLQGKRPKVEHPDTVLARKAKVA
jgi:hypothetical protein